MYEARQNKEKVSRRIEVSGGTKQRKKERSNKAVNLLSIMQFIAYKRVQAHAKIARNPQKNASGRHFYNIDKTGVSYSGRNGVNNSDIERMLTTTATRFNNRRERVNSILIRSRESIVLTQKVEDRMNRQGDHTGWGNCAEPHAVYEIARQLGENDYIVNLKIDNAYTVDDEGMHRYSSTSDARCRNCSQWCPTNNWGARFPTN